MLFERTSASGWAKISMCSIACSSSMGSDDAGKQDAIIRGIKTMETLPEEALDQALDRDKQREVNLEIAQGRNRPRGMMSINTGASTGKNPS